MLKCLRVGDTWSYNSFLASNVPSLSTALSTNSLTYHPPYTTEYSFDALEEDFRTIIQHPIYSAYISMLLRNLPLRVDNYREVEDKIRRESFWKEFRTTQEIRREPALNYDAIFRRQVSSWHPAIPVRPELQLDIHERLQSWKMKVSQRVLYPRYSRRSMGQQSSDALGEALYPNTWSYGKLTTRDYERHYHQTGETVDGIIEMRQAWFFNDLKPRTYFAQGGEMYRDAKYMQSIANSLLDSFPMTHRFSRFNLRRLRFRELAIAVVHDYADFTSRMAEQIYFLDALADFCKGTIVAILDTRYGVTEVDLGDIIRQYNRTCNIDGRFRLSQQLLELTGLDDLEYEHRVAGFLGVYANLATCTVLHGIHLALATGSYSACSCVGDDGLSVYEPETFDEFEEGEIRADMYSKDAIFEALSVLGNISIPKTKVFDPRIQSDEDSSCWTYLKRRLDREDDQFTLGRLDDYPSLAIASYDWIQTTRRLNGTLDDVIVAKKIASSAFSLLRTIYDRRLELSEAEIHLAFDHLRILYKRFRLPMKGWLSGGLRGEMQNLPWLRGVTIVPAISKERDSDVFMARQNPLANLVKSLRLEGWDGPELSSEKIEFDIGSVGTSFRGTGKKPLAVLEDLGYLRKSIEREFIDSSDILDRLEFFFDRKSRIVYRYFVVRTLPFWVDDLVVRGEL